MIDRGLEVLGTVLDRYEPLNDKEVRALQLRDLYGSSLQFGDPYILLHLDCDMRERYSVLEFIHLFIKRETRVEFMTETMKGFSDVAMLGHVNIQRLLYNYNVIGTYAHHVIVRKKLK